MEPGWLIGGVGALGLGLSLGIFGAGGSILAVPLLLYAFGFSAEEATHFSLLVVGVTSLAGFILGKGKTPLDRLMVFALPAMAGMYAARRFLLPALPPVLPWIDMPKATFLISFFSLFMVAAAIAMIRPKPAREGAEPASAFVFAASGAAVGIVTGIAGAGGGFLIVPALVLFAGMPFGAAARASLALIALNSLWGFFVSPMPDTIPYQALGMVILSAILGMLAGIRLRSRLPAEKLKPAFGFFLLVLGGYMLWRA